MNPNDPFFPVSTLSHPLPTGGFANEIEGGLTIRQGVALHVLQGLVSNSGIDSSEEKLVRVAYRTADAFLALETEPKRSS